MGSGGWRTIEHTADLGLEVVAPSLEGLFTTGALGLAGLLLGSEAGPASPGREATVWRDLTVDAPDTEALLVDWLRELLYIQMAEGLLFAAAEVEELGDSRLVARVGFAPLAENAPLQRELKGVTYHDLEVRRRNNGWYARIVFDL